MKNPTVLVVGGNSDIGLATVKRFAALGYDIQLVGRNLDALLRSARDIEIRFRVGVWCCALDVCKPAEFPEVIDSFPVLPDVVICCVGLLGEQSEDEQSYEQSLRVFTSNYCGPALFLGLIYNKLEERGSGSIIGVSSVAGDRGRRSNYIYGSAKAGFSEFLSGLRSRGQSQGVHVITIKPGFVRTKMTAHLSLPRLLSHDAGQIAKIIVNAHLKRINVRYSNVAWRIIMLVIGVIPESVFKRLPL